MLLFHSCFHLSGTVAAARTQTSEQTCYRAFVSQRICLHYFLFYVTFHSLSPLSGTVAAAFLSVNLLLFTGFFQYLWFNIQLAAAAGVSQQP